MSDWITLVCGFSLSLDNKEVNRVTSVVEIEHTIINVLLWILIGYSLYSLVTFLLGCVELLIWNKPICLIHPTLCVFSIIFLFIWVLTLL